MKGVFKKRLKDLFFFHFILLWGFSPLTALNPQKAITQYRLDIWQEERGFDPKAVCAITQTHDGYIWLGTSGGVVRFDGLRFKVFDKANTKELKSNVIRALCQDRQGNLWIGTYDGGLTCQSKGKFKTYSTKECEALGKISSLSQDREGALWIGTLSNGVTRLQDGKFTTYTVNDGLAGNKILSIYRDRIGNLWFATSKGVTRRSPTGEFTGNTGESRQFSKYTYSFCETKKGELWIGTNDGLYRVKDQTLTHYGVNDGLPNAKVKCLCEDRDQNLWGGTDGGGLFRIKDGKTETFSTDDGMAGDCVYSIYEDKEGSLWIGTIKGGAHRLRDTIVTTYTTKEGLAHNRVNWVHEGQSGALWIGSEGGVNRLKDGELTLELTAKQGLLSNIVYSILEDSTGALWIGTEAGLNRFKNGKISSYTTKDGLSHHRILNLLEDKQGAVWIGVPNNLHRFHKEKLTPLIKKEKTPNNAIRCIYEDKDGSPWLGTFGGGLYRLKDETMTAYTVKEGLVSNDVECIYQDKEGILYIGTRGGISRLAEGKFTNYTTRNGLIDIAVHRILEDERGNLWLAGRAGLSCVSKKELSDLAEGKIDKIHPVIYDESAGMKTRWCTDGAGAHDGKLWFTTGKGLVMIDSTTIDIKKSTPPPPVIIEELRVDGEYINTREGAPLTLSPGKERLEFYYTGLSFVNSRKIGFKIKLVGYDKDWLDVGYARSTIYTNLTPGKYTFKVTARNSDGEWNQTGDSLPFYIKPYFHQTTWFYILMVLFIGFSVLSTYRFRVRQLKTREKKLSALVDLRTKALNDRTLQLENAHHIIEEKNRNILASIEYARRIQQAILPTDDRIRMVLTDYFILFKPRDIVSGDFYWFSQKEDNYFIAAVDCTGHGVPGALLSMIGNMKLNEIVNEKSISDPGQLLSFLHQGVRTALKQENNEGKADDGMDIGVCMMDLKKGKVTFAGAGRPLFYNKDSEFSVIKGDRKPIGGRQREKQRTFTNHEIDFQEEITLYLTTDGFAHQNSPEGKKYGSLHLKRFLHANAHLSTAQQKEALAEALKSHQGNEEQRDDITIIGVKLKKQLLKKR